MTTPRSISALVDLTTISERHDDNQQHAIGECVDDVVVTDAHSQTGPSRKRPGGRRSRIPRQQCKRALHAAANWGFELSHRPNGRRAQLDPILAQVQPRSALT